MVNKAKIEEKNKLQAIVFDIKGAEIDKINLSASVFGVEPNTNLVSHYVRVYLANQRQGNASTKTRGEIVGTTKKMYRQKGTGRARHSTSKVNLFRGGGVTFGPQTRDISLKMNKKQKVQALFSTLSSKYTASAIKIVSTQAFENRPSTKTMSALLKKITSGKKTLIVMDQVSANPIVLSFRNLPKVTLTQANTLNAYQVMNSNNVVFLDNSVNTLESHYLKS